MFAGWIDGQGQVWLSGRKKDMIKSGGENVNSSEVEAVLQSHPGVVNACVVALPHPRLGETVGALLVLHESYSWNQRSRPAQAQSQERQISLHLIQQWCREQHLAGFKLPRVVHGSHVALPSTATGKVDKQRARDLLHAVRQGNLHSKL